MKKNFLTPVLQNKVVSTVTKYCSTHKSALLATGTIGFSCATTAVVFKNSPRIHAIIWDTRDAIEAANNEEEKKAIYKAAFKELAPLVAPIIIFQTGTIVTVLIAKKDSDNKDKKIAELSAAVSVASQAIEQYNQFQKEAEEQLGEKKLNKVRDNITASNGKIMCENIDLGPGEIIFKDVYSGHVFKGTKDTVRLACERMCNEAKDNDEAVVVLTGEYYDTLGIPYNELGSKFGYYAQSSSFSVSPHFAATEAEVNGTTMPAYEVWLSPSPEYIDN